MKRFEAAATSIAVAEREPGTVVFDQDDDWVGVCEDDANFAARVTKCVSTNFEERGAEPSCVDVRNRRSISGVS